MGEMVLPPCVTGAYGHLHTRRSRAGCMADASTKEQLMADVVRAALVQATWTGDTESMIAKHEEYARAAAAQGAKVIGFQEVFNAPYFCQVQEPEHYRWAEPVPDGPTVRRMQDLARETGMVIVVPVFEVEQAGFYYNTAAVIDADGTVLGTYRKHHIPQVKGFWEKYYFKPGNAGFGRSSTPPSARSVSTSATTATFPRAGGSWASTAPSWSTTPPPPPAACPPTSGSWSSPRPPSPTSTSSRRSTGSASRSTATTTSTAPATSSTPEASSSATSPATPRRNWSSATSTSP